MNLTGGASVSAGDVNGDGVPDLYVVQARFGKVGNEPDLLLLNNGSGTAFTPMSIPEASTGVGAHAYPIGFENNGLTDFLVFNDLVGASPAPLQLISFFPDAPLITSASGDTVASGSSFTFTVTTTGSPAPSLAESGALPPGVTFVDNGNGTATVAGVTGSTGTFPVTITASNGLNPSAQQAFTLTVT